MSERPPPPPETQYNPYAFADWYSREWPQILRPLVDGGRSEHVPLRRPHICNNCNKEKIYQPPVCCPRCRNLRMYGPPEMQPLFAEAFRGIFPERCVCPCICDNPNQDLESDSDSDSDWTPADDSESRDDDMEVETGNIYIDNHAEDYRDHDAYPLTYGTNAHNTVNTTTHVQYRAENYFHNLAARTHDRNRPEESSSVNALNEITPVEFENLVASLTIRGRTPEGYTFAATLASQARPVTTEELEAILLAHPDLRHRLIRTQFPELHYEREILWSRIPASYECEFCHLAISEELLDYLRRRILKICRFCDMPYKLADPFLDPDEELNRMPETTWTHCRCRCDCPRSHILPAGYGHDPSPGVEEPEPHRETVISRLVRGENLPVPDREDANLLSYGRLLEGEIFDEIRTHEEILEIRGRSILADELNHRHDNQDLQQEGGPPTDTIEPGDDMELDRPIRFTPSTRSSRRLAYERLRRARANRENEEQEDQEEQEGSLIQRLWPDGLPVPADFDDDIAWGGFAAPMHPRPRRPDTETNGYYRVRMSDDSLTSWRDEWAERRASRSRSPEPLLHRHTRPSRIERRRTRRTRGSRRSR